MIYSRELQIFILREKTVLEAMNSVDIKRNGILKTVVRDG